MKVSKLIFPIAAILCLVSFVTAKDPPKWEPVYQVKGVLRIPYAGEIV